MATISQQRPNLGWGGQFTLSFYWLTWNLQWTAIIVILMPLQVLAMVGEENKATAVGIVTSIGAIISLALPPLIGALSDRTRSRMGRRKPYMLWGSVIDGGALLLLAFVPLWFEMPWAIVLYVLAMMLLQFGSSVATSPYSALIPDVVPKHQMGQASGWLALMSLLGIFLGNFLGGFHSDLFGGIVETYWAMLGLFTIGSLITILGVREPKPPLADRFNWKEFLNGLIEPLKNHNFRWVFLTRLFVEGGQWTVQAFLLFYFTDLFFKSGQPIELFGLVVDKPEQSVMYFLTAVLLGAIPSSYVAGHLSDKFGRKPMVYIASGLMSVVVILFAFNVIPVFVGVVLLGLVFGLGHGTYKSVDWALACDVLPSEDDFAKDMGVWHIAMMVPQVLFLPIAGFLLDTFQKVGQSAGVEHLGYTVIFSMACVLFVLGTVFIVKIRGVR